MAAPRSSPRIPRRSTGDPDLDRSIAALLASVALSSSDKDGRLDNRDQLRDLLTTAVQMAMDTAEGRADRLDVKIAAAALSEMRDAYLTFGPHRATRKVTIFGSARTQPSDPLYAQTRAVAKAFADRGWMVVTGAGPGIMAAGLEGAGRDNALGVSISLPFESTANEYVDGDRLVDMRYFFTRKLALIRESAGFVVMPGGFGTLDEAFELLTLLQTGKATPVPVVMLGLGHGYWTAWQQFVEKVADEGYVSSSDNQLYVVTNDTSVAVDEICGFYANFHSIRWVRDVLVVRMQRGPTDVQLASARASFAEFIDADGIWRTEPLPPELSEHDQLELARVAMRFNRRQPGRLRGLIDTVNGW